MSRLRLIVGIISGDSVSLEPLLKDLFALSQQAFIEELSVVVLENATSNNSLHMLVQGMRAEGLPCALISERQQRADTSKGSFEPYLIRAGGQVGIAQARTMLQRYLGEIVSEDKGSVAWILDDDMRVDSRANCFLPWLLSFQDVGVDALIGAHEGSSPNPPLNGLRVQLVDLWHNLDWMATLDANAPLPDRAVENRVLRLRFPDYYYDLSRRHTEHLEIPHWLVPAFPQETVGEARTRLMRDAVGLLSGAGLTRPVLVEMPERPLEAAVDSVNRGGNTFILNPSTLLEVPNLALGVGSREARRSDMVWAIINRYYRRKVIKRVAFPVLHVGRVTSVPVLDLVKVVGEIVGSAFYGAFTDFLGSHESHDFDFTGQDVEEICTMVESHAERRLLALSGSFERIRELTPMLAMNAGVEGLVLHLREWFTSDVLESIQAGVHRAGRDDIVDFLTSLKRASDGYARTEVIVDVIRKNLRTTKSRGHRP